LEVAYEGVVREEGIGSLGKLGSTFSFEKLNSALETFTYAEGG